MTRRILLAVLTLALLATLMPGATTFAGCKKCFIKGYVKAMGEGDLDRLAASYADRVVLSNPHGQITLDHQAMSDLLAWEVAAGVTLTASEYEWEGDTVRALFTETSELYELMGVGELTYRVTFDFEGDVIRSVAMEPVAGGADLYAAFTPVSQWIAMRRADAPQGD
jgi:hypothetical protein